MQKTKISIEQESTSFISKIFVKNDTPWKQYGINIAGRNGQGNQFDQLYYLHGIFIDDKETIYIADWGNNCIIQWKSNMKNEQGNRINQLSGPIDVIINQKTSSLIIADGGNSREMRWSPQEVIADQVGQIFVADWGNHRVMRWCQGAKEGAIVVGGGKELGCQSNQLSYPRGLSFDRQGNIYVVDCWNHRIQKFEVP